MCAAARGRSCGARAWPARAVRRRARAGAVGGALVSLAALGGVLLLRGGCAGRALAQRGARARPAGARSRAHAKVNIGVPTW